MKHSHARLIHSTALESHHYPAQCPFSSQRARMAVETMRSLGLITDREVTAPASRGSTFVERFHTAEYIDILKTAESGHFEPDMFAYGLGTPETPVFKGMVDYATLAASASLTGAELMVEKQTGIAFNPSGGYHHAEPERASGFCYINDAGLACEYLARHADRVMYIDIDVHHGDGVQNFFYNRRDVMTVSLHETGKEIFPGTGFENEIGTGDGTGYSVNLPLPRGTFDRAYIRAFTDVVEPLLRAYDPQYIVMEMGMDCLSGDPLAHLELTNNAYADVLERVIQFAKPMLVVGGGGYNPENTARGWALAWSVMSGRDNTEDIHAGMGGIMLENTEWQGGLRDRRTVVDNQTAQNVSRKINKSVEKIKANVFHCHGI